MREVRLAEDLPQRQRQRQRQRGKEVDLSEESSATLFTAEGVHHWALRSVAGRRGSKQQVRTQGTEGKGTQLTRGKGLEPITA